MSTRIGLLSDTHVTKRGELWPQVFDAFAGVDAILHAGDVWAPALLDELEAIAPVHVARGNGDFGVDDDRLRDHCVLTFDGRDGADAARLPSPARRGADFVHEQVAKRFPNEAPDVLVCGHTHMEEIHRVGDLLYVNPGSPTLPHNKSLRLGTIGFLTIAHGVAQASYANSRRAASSRWAEKGAHGSSL